MQGLGQFEKILKLASLPEYYPLLVAAILQACSFLKCFNEKPCLKHNVDLISSRLDPSIILEGVAISLLAATCNDPCPSQLAALNAVACRHYRSCCHSAIKKKYVHFNSSIFQTISLYIAEDIHRCIFHLVCSVVILYAHCDHSQTPVLCVVSPYLGAHIAANNQTCPFKLTGQVLCAEKSSSGRATAISSQQRSSKAERTKVRVFKLLGHTSLKKAELR